MLKLENFSSVVYSLFTAAQEWTTYYQTEGLTYQEYVRYVYRFKKAINLHIFMYQTQILFYDLMEHNYHDAPYLLGYNGVIKSLFIFC